MSKNEFPRVLPKDIQSSTENCSISPDFSARGAKYVNYLWCLRYQDGMHSEVRDEQGQKNGVQVDYKVDSDGEVISAHAVCMLYWCKFNTNKKYKGKKG